MPDASRRTELMARFSKYAPYRLQRWVYKLSGGKLWTTTPGGKLKILLLTTTGRKSGKPRTHPVMYYRDGENYVIVASNAGRDKHPLWYLNLKACPEATVQVGSVTHRVLAHEAGVEARTRLWPSLTEMQPVFTAFEKFTERQIPVIILRPIQ